LAGIVAGWNIHRGRRAGGVAGAAATIRGVESVRGHHGATLASDHHGTSQEHHPAVRRAGAVRLFPAGGTGFRARPSPLFPDRAAEPSGVAGAIIAAALSGAVL